MVSRPGRKLSSIIMARPCTTAPACSISWAVARAVPPVASTSSMTRTRSPACERVGVHLEGLLAVLQLVADRAGLPGQLAGLAHGHEADPERERHGCREDEPAGLHADDLVDHDRPVLVTTGVGERLDDSGEGRVVVEQRGDVLEGHPRLREVGDVADRATRSARSARPASVTSAALTCRAWTAAAASAGCAWRPRTHAPAPWSRVRRGPSRMPRAGAAVPGPPVVCRIAPRRRPARGRSPRGVTHRQVLGEHRDVGVAVRVALLAGPWPGRPAG